MGAAELGPLDSLGGHDVHLATDHATIAGALCLENACGFRHPLIFPRPLVGPGRDEVSHDPSLPSLMELYANAFTTTPGHCWQMVHDPDPRKIWDPVHCSELVRVRGVFRTEEGKRRL